MEDCNYILVNGSFVLANDYRITIRESEGFLFAEKFRAVRTSLQFFKETLDSITFKLQIYNQSYPELTENNGAGLKRQLERTLTKNKQFMGAVLMIRFWISEQNMKYSIQCSKTENIGYELNNKGLYISIFRDIKKSVSTLSDSSIGSDIYWKITANCRKDSFIDEFLLINTDDSIIESIGSNVYLIKNGIVRGASVQQGAYADITKPLILNIFESQKIGYNENEAITEQDLNDAEEIFLVNAIDGIRWVVGYEGKRYFNNTIRRINESFIRNLLS